MRAVLMLAALTVAVPDRQDPTPKEEKPLQVQLLGDWRIHNEPEDGVLRVLRFTPTEALILVDGIPWPDDTYSGPYTLDVAKNPVTIDILRTKWEGILKLDGDQLILSMSAGGKRPKAFSPDAGLALQRIKK